MASSTTHQYEEASRRAVSSISDPYRQSIVPEMSIFSVALIICVLQQIVKLISRLFVDPDRNSGNAPPSCIANVSISCVHLYFAVYHSGPRLNQGGNTTAGIKIGAV
jgi:Na+/alanine symporter